MKIKKPSLGFPCCFRKVLLFCACVDDLCALHCWNNNWWNSREGHLDLFIPGVGCTFYPTFLKGDQKLLEGSRL